jgi:cell division protein FtsA
VLTLPVRIGEPSGVHGLIDDVVNPAYATPVGLILYAASSEPMEIASGIARRIKLPGGNYFGKMFDMVKDLLP